MSSENQVTRRTFVKTAATAASVIAVPTMITRPIRGQEAASERVTMGFIGVGSRGNAHVNGLTGKPGVQAMAACDVDRNYLDRARNTIIGKNKKLGRGETCDTYIDYRQMIERKDIDAVVITTPDHWHTRIAVDAMRAGKDVYCEKPLTLTIEEGKLICQVVTETGRIFQVGTQQRSGRQFLETVAFVRDGGLGKVSKVNCSIGAPPTCPPQKAELPPTDLDWDRWQGQTPRVPYTKRRCHYEFRWWYEYSGGKMTDWGAHHVDIAQWGIGMEKTGPHTIGGTSKHPVAFKDGYPTETDRYNTAVEFDVKAVFANGVEMTIRHDGQNGITFTGEKGEVFVSRNGNTGKLNGQKLPVTPEQIAKVYKTDMGPDHYGNWLHCLKSRGEPVSDVFSHHRILTTCHLANIAIRLDRKLRWDPVKEQIIGDEQANKMVGREQWPGYEIDSRA